MAESQNERYAVIAARRNEIFPGGVVIAYGDEESMRELIAAPSIIEIGSCSHEAAVAVIANNSAGDADSEKTQKKHASRPEGHDRESQPPRQHLRRRTGLAEARRIASATLQSAVAAGVLMFYSRSVHGALIRAFVGA